MVDTSTEAVEMLLDGVRPGPWEFDPRYITIVSGEKCIAEVFASDADASFIAAARDLVPALLAERDALAQSRSHFKSHYDANKARVKRLRHRQRALVSALEIVTKAESFVDAKQAASLALGGWEDETLIYTARITNPTHHHGE